MSFNDIKGLPYRQLWCIRKSMNWRKLGMKGKDITYERYSSILEEQGGVCAICGSAPKKGRMLAWDHCHKTGAPRGILCNQCNLCLAQFEPGSRFLKGFNYLRKYRSRPVDDED